MKFTTAWANVSSENNALKFIILILCCLSGLFGLTTLKLALREPLVIDRGCTSKAASSSDGKRSNEEFAAFLKEALSQRFDTNLNPHDGFLSADEISNKAKEQQDLKTRNLKQSVLFNSAEISGNQILVDTDRIISVGEVRSAFKFPISVKISSFTRSAANPYGLVLEETKLQKKGDK